MKTFIWIVVVILLAKALEILKDLSRPGGE